MYRGCSTIISSNLCLVATAHGRIFREIFSSWRNLIHFISPVLVSVLELFMYIYFFSLQCDLIVSVSQFDLTCFSDGAHRLVQ